MADLQRARAPFSAAAWREIDDEARGMLKLMLAGRRFVDFDGPRGWNFSSVDLGRARALDAPPGEGVRARLRQTRPLIELEAHFTLDRREIEAIERGASDADLGPVADAAKQLALSEDRIIFDGYAAAGVVGIAEAAADATVTIPGDYEAYPSAVAEAISNLRMAGVDGPYGVALGPRCWQGLTTTTAGGYPIMKLIERLIDGPIVWAPAVDGAVVVSTRGGDYELTVGRDISIGYRDHDAESVRLYLQESLAFRVIAPDAAVPLRYR